MNEINDVNMIESIKRLYYKHKISIDQIKKMVKENKITASEYEYIISGGD